MKRFSLLIGLFFFASAASPDGWAAPHEIKRKVLALYKSTEGDSAFSNRTVELLEHPLDVLGLVVDYWDIDQGFPTSKQLEPYRAVLSFYRGQEIADPKAYASWIAQQPAQGRKVLIFGDYGGWITRKTKDFIDRKTAQKAFGALGLDYRGYWITDRALISLQNQDESMMGYEEPLRPEEIAPYVWIRSLDARNVSSLNLVRKDVPESQSSLVVITPQGAYAMGDYLLYEYRQDGIEKQRWHLNPYRFLAKALGLEQEPRFDFSTLNGRRIMIAHIDGDGFTTPSKLGRSCAEVVEQGILNAYEVPIAASVITSELIKYPQFQETAKRIFALPHVQPASHSASHPLDWQKPEVNAEREVQDSLTYLNKVLVPEQKPAVLFAWSGLCNPQSSAFQALASWGGYNINGPNTSGGVEHRFDRHFPSRTYLPPLVKRVGKYLQFEHLAANDFAMTSSLEGDLGGFQDIIPTWEKTRQDPEMPVHVYFHWYSGENAKSLNALKRIFEWAKNEPLAPIQLTEYVDLIRDFRKAQIFPEGPGRYRIKNAGQCRTLVLPGETPLDMAASENVLGYAVRNKALYVFLDENTDHLLVLGQEEAPAPHLISASGWVESWTKQENKIYATIRSYGPTVLELGPLEGKSYEVVIRPNDKQFSGQTLALSTKDKTLTLSFHGTGVQTLEIVPVGAARRSFLMAGPAVMGGFVASFSIWFLLRRRKEGLS